MGGEGFHIKGLVVVERGYLDVYKYEKWSDSYLPSFQVGDKINPEEVNMVSGTTSPPKFISESELISLMDKHGIGTDATIHEHIKTIIDRNYTIRTGNIFKPTLIGTSLIKAYEKLGIPIYMPYIRAQMERDMKEVSEGKRNKVINLIIIGINV